MKSTEGFAKVAALLLSLSIAATSQSGSAEDSAAALHITLNGVEVDSLPHNALHPCYNAPEG